MPKRLEVKAANFSGLSIILPWAFVLNSMVCISFPHFLHIYDALTPVSAS
jgi:hypothetical protein